MASLFISPSSLILSENETGHPHGCPVSFWLREEDSNFRPHLCGARNALFSLSLGAFRPRQRACCSLYPALRALAPAHRLFAQGLITLGRRRKLIHNKKIKGTPKGVPLISGCGRKIRTSDLRVMSPTSYPCSTPRYITPSQRVPT